MTKELVEQKMELTQKELQARVTEFQGLQKRAEELQVSTQPEGADCHLPGFAGWTTQTTPASFLEERNGDFD